MSAGEDLFDEVGEIVPALPPKQGRVPAPNSRGSTPTLAGIAVPRPPSRKGIEVNDSTFSLYMRLSFRAPVQIRVHYVSEFTDCILR